MNNKRIKTMARVAGYESLKKADIIQKHVKHKFHVQILIKLCMRIYMTTV